MPQSLPFRILLVGVEDSLVVPLRTAVADRPVEVARCAEIADACAHALAHPDLADLLIAPADAHLIRPLAHALPGRPIIALLPPGAGVAQVVSAQRAGAAQVVPLPLSTDDFLSAIDRAALLLAPAERPAQIIAVCGVSGGCGATTLALNLAYELGRLDQPTVRRPPCLLVELANRLGALATYLNIEPATTSSDLLADPARLSVLGVRQALVTVVPGLDVLVGPNQGVMPSSTTPRNIEQLLLACRRLGSAVVLDVPCSFDDLMFETLALVDRIVLVGVQSFASVRSLKLVRDTLEREEGLRNVRLLINRYDPSLPGFAAQHLAELLAVPQVATLANDYPSVMLAANHGKPLGLAVPHSRIRADIQAVARSLLEVPATPPSASDRSSVPATGVRSPELHPVRVLHVEDDLIQQQAMQLHLSAIPGFTFEIAPAVSEAAALETFRARPIDVVLLDYHLAQGNGLSCLRQLRAIDPMIPVVVISGEEHPQIVNELLDAGADDFLSKENITGKTLGRALSQSVARVGAIRSRSLPPALEGPTPLDAYFERIRRSVADEPELVNSMQELHRSARHRRLSAGQIQRLADLVSEQLDEKGRQTTHRAVLTLFMRLLGNSV